MPEKRGDTSKHNTHNQLTVAKAGRATGFLHQERITILLKYGTTLTEEIFSGVLLS